MCLLQNGYKRPLCEFKRAIIKAERSDTDGKWDAAGVINIKETFWRTWMQAELAGALESGQATEELNCWRKRCRTCVLMGGRQRNGQVVGWNCMHDGFLLRKKMQAVSAHATHKWWMAIPEGCIKQWRPCWAAAMGWWWILYLSDLWYMHWVFGWQASVRLYLFRCYIFVFMGLDVGVLPSLDLFFLTVLICMCFQPTWTSLLVVPFGLWK